VIAKAASAASGADAVEAYLAKVPEPALSALQHLRQVIRGAAPGAEEALVYGVPGFRLKGPLVCYAAHKSHCGFYPMAPGLLDGMETELTSWRISKGTISFTPELPLPDELVVRIVRARVDRQAAGRSR
jgi:uncharacterized protein YdhG (YjbR/CyaY superfamily)